jgi:trimeric autotransporter adhesin
MDSSKIQFAGCRHADILVVMNPLRLIALSLCLGVSLFISSCGGGSNSAGTGSNTPPTPAIGSISPKSIIAGSGSLALTVSGSEFLSTSVVQVGGIAVPTSYVSGSQLTASVPASQLTSGAELAVVVVNGSASSASGTPINLEVDNPAPTISSVSPASELLGTAAPVVTVTGTGFVSSTVINVNGTARTTTFVSPTQISATLTAADVSVAGALLLTAMNPTPGGGTSTAASFVVNNPPVGTIQLQPSVLTAGATSPATITITGSNFVPASVVQVNAVTRAATYVNSTTITFVATVADQAKAGTLQVTVTNPAPGGGTSPVANLIVSVPTPTPVITSVSPDSLIVGSSDTVITLAGTGFTQNSVVQWNGASLSTEIYYYYGALALTATVPAADLTATGTASVKVETPTSNPSLSNAVSVKITNPPAPTLTSISPNAGPINTAATVTLNGTGFTSLSVVSVNGESVACTVANSSQITCPIPASSLALPGNVNFAVTTPAPGGGTSAPMPFTVYLAITNNDIVYNAKDGLLYASIPVSAIGSGGNTVAGIDPVTGNIVRQIWVGSNPNKLALSTDGTQLFVGLDGAAAVAQVDLNKAAVVNQFSLGGGPGVYNPPYTANYLAAVPGSPNSVAVASTGSFDGGSDVTIYDSGVPRTVSPSGVGEGPLSFGSSSSVLYVVNGSIIEQLAADSTGITKSTTLGSASSSVTSIQYDNGRLYLSNGQVFDASTGALKGTLYSAANTPASGAVVSDSTLGRVFVGSTNFDSSAQVLAFDESTFNSDGSIPVNGVGAQGYPTNFQKIVRWGQNGLALSAAASAFSSTNQLFIFQSPLVKDLSASPADLSVTLTAPSTTTTGTAGSWVAKISNQGPNQAQGTTLAMNLDSSLILNSVTPGQGSCGTGTQFTCDLGSLASGASVSVTVNATASTAGTLAAIADISSTSYDPTVTNNQATASTVVSGNLYSAAPSISAISPNLVQAGSSDFTLTVTGAGFNEQSTVDLGTTALATTYVSSTQLTATVTASQIANYGWAPVTVTNAAPGGGVSQIQPLTIYAMVNVPASGLLFDPYSQQLYATTPSTSTNVTGNSVVSIDPLTGVVGTPVLVGSEPNVMTETSDGNYLYIGLSGSNSLAQFDLLHQSVKATIPLSLTQYGSTGGVTATWLAAMPGSDTTLAVDMTNTWGNFGIFDISGSTGSFRPNLSGIYSGVNPIFADASHVYAYDSQTSGAEFYRYSVDTNGLTLIDGTTLDGMGGFSGSIRLANGLVYGAGGGIVNPATTPPSQIATLPFLSSDNSAVDGFGVAIAADPSLQKEFLIIEDLPGTSTYDLVRYNLTTYLPEALVNMPTSASSLESAWTMLRFGQDGLALLSLTENYATNQSVPVVMLLRGPFVTPQELSTSSAATLTASSSSSIAHGSGNTLLTLTGSNLLPGVAITWNGSYRTTTRVDSGHVTVAIPASDLANAGTASLVATNPGASGSNSLQVTIH